MKKQIFHLEKPQADPYQIKIVESTNYDPSQHLILWSIRLFDHILIMPELTILVQEFYCFN